MSVNLMSLCRAVCLVFCLVASWTVRAEHRSLVRAEADLSNNAVLALHQDDRGDMWIGTYDGLHCYNSHNTCVYRMDLDDPNSLCSNIIMKIVPAEKGSIWVTTSLGVNKFSIDDRCVALSSYGHNDVRHIAADRLGNMIFLDLNDSLNYYTPQLNEVRQMKIPSLKTEQILALWNGSERTFYSLNRDGQILCYKVQATNNETSVEVEIFAQIDHGHLVAAQYCEGRIYFLDKHAQLYSYWLDTGRLKHLSDLSQLGVKAETVTSFAKLKDKIFLLYRGGLLVELPDEGGAYRTRQMDYRLFSLCADRFQDILWIGTDGWGLMMYYHQERGVFTTLQLKHISEKLLKPVRAIYADDADNLWLGTKGDGVIRLSHYSDYKGGRIPRERIRIFNHKDGLSSDEVFSFAASRRWNLLWFGCEGDHLSYYSFDQERVCSIALGEGVEPMSRVHQIHAVNDSTLYFSNVARGLIEVNLTGERSPQIKSVHRYSFERGGYACNEFYAVTQNSDSTLLIGTCGGYGLISFHIHTKKYSFVDLSKFNTNVMSDILSICHTSRDELLLGTSSCLIHVDQNAQPHRFTREDGFLNDMIHGVLEDRFQNIWFSTNKGLVQYNPQKKSFHSYAHNIRELGVTEFCDDAFWRCPKTDKLFFGGVNGVVWVDPTLMPQSSYTPALRFLTMTHSDGEVEPLHYEHGETKAWKALVVQPHIHQFSVSFVAVDYLHGENFKYAYWLEGFSDQWIELDNTNQVSFFNLPAGEYRLHVRYRSNVMDENSIVATLPMRILPPWYRTTVAYWAYVLVSLVLVGGFIYFFRRHYHREQELAIARMEEMQREKIYEARVNFLANISHELCTPLTLINSMNEHLSEYANKERNVLKYTQVMRENVQGLNDLIQEILNFRKIEEEGFGDIRIRRVNISELLVKQVVAFDEAAKVNQIAIQLDVAPQLEWNTSRGFVRKIISNLVSNAMKYTPKAGKIRISACIEKKQTTSDEQLVLRFWNTGRGIAPDQLSKVFDRYRILERMDRNMYTDKASRNGLGLYICRGLTDALGGSISVDSRVDEYAEFVVRLPFAELREEDQVSDSKSEATIGKDLEQNTQSERHTVLVVDDHKDILWLISSTLSDRFRVTQASSVDEAIESLRTQTPDLIITDIVMPDRSGLDLINYVRNDKFLRSIPIVVVSAKITEREQVEGLAMGADAYLTKPFAESVLRATVGRLVENRTMLKEFYNTPESVYTVLDGQKMHEEDKTFIDEVVRTLHENLSQDGLGVEFLAEHMGLTTRNFSRKFKKILNRTPSDYIKDYRFETAANLLIKSDLTVLEIMYRVGISNKSYFYREFQKKYGMKPKEYKSSQMG